MQTRVLRATDLHLNAQPIRNLHALLVRLIPEAVRHILVAPLLDRHVKHLRRIQHTPLAHIHLRVDVIPHVIVREVRTSAGQRGENTVVAVRVILQFLAEVLFHLGTLFASVTLVILNNIRHIRLNHVILNHVLFTLRIVLNQIGHVRLDYVACFHCKLV